MLGQIDIPHQLLDSSGVIPAPYNARSIAAHMNGHGGDLPFPDGTDPGLTLTGVAGYLTANNIHIV
jgi:hypothetical protein